MLQIIMGRSGSGKTTYIRERIKELIESGKENVTVIIPEQNSFETETAMLDMLGAKDACKVEIVSFTRLVDLILRTYGGIAGERLNEGGRNILMSLAIEDVADNLTLYKKQAGKTELVPLMLSAVNEFKMCAISSDFLREKALLANDKVLKDKLNETALIMDGYDALLQGSYIDPMDDLTRLKVKLENHPYFMGRYVFIDAFNGFTVQEINIIELILRQCEECYVVLSGNHLSVNNENNLFYTINRTKRDLTELAKRNGIEVKKPIILDKQYRFNSSGLTALENGVYRPDHGTVISKVDDVELFMANDIYTEVNYVARTIKKLVTENGYTYSDFAVVCRQTANYRGIIDSAFDRYGIPYFMDKPQDIDSKPLFALVLLAFETAGSSFASDYIYRYLKTGLAGLDADDIATLENYTFTWSITGRKWLEDFTAHPEGFADKMTEKNEEQLEYINSLRRKVIKPLERFAEGIKSDSALDISKAVYRLLQDINCAENLKAVAEELEKDGKPSQADEQLRIWDSLMEMLDEMARLTNSRHLDFKNYAKLLRTVITLGDISFIPRTLDEVTVGTADRIRLSSPRAVFIIGAIDGEFPHMPVAAGVFSDAERRKLLSLDLPMYDSVAQLAVQEKYHAYCAISAPREKLFVSWHCADLRGNVKKPSSIIREIVKILPDIKIMTEESYAVSDKIWSEGTAFDIYAREAGSSSYVSKQLEAYFKSKPEYAERLKAVKRIKTKTAAIIENAQIAHELFSINTKLSASQIEKYHLCRFMYFCAYGLRAKERKPAEIDALGYGSLMHWVLENIFRKYKGQNICELSSKTLAEEIDLLLDEYVQTNLGGLDDKTERFKYLYFRLRASAHSLIKHIANELAQSEFVPVDFELDIAKGGDVEAYKLVLPDGRTVTVEGKVDRVDVMEKNGVSYVRIIDYKTGTKVFKLSDILYGLNMQMLIYLSAISTNGKPRYGEIIPAGVLYMPASAPVVSTDARDDERAVEQERGKKFAMNGLILENNLVIRGMESEAKGIFIPVGLNGDTVTKGKDSLASLEQMGMIFKRIDSLISDMAISLDKGEIYDIPSKGEYDACQWCPYNSVCGHEDDDMFRDIVKMDREAVMKNLYGEEGGEA